MRYTDDMHTIGIDASRANRLEKTGIEWYAYRLLNAMRNITDPKDRFLLYTDEKLRDDLANLPNGWKERVLGWPSRKFWTQGRLSLEMLFRAPDLLFIPSHVIPVIHPKRVVLTCHDIGFERRPELYPKAELAYHRWSMRFGVRAATHIIAVSEFTKQELMDVYGLPAGKVTVIHHGFYGGSVEKIFNFPFDKLRVPSCVEGQFPISNKIPNSKFQIPNSYFLFVGRIEAKKNLGVIIDSFSQLKHDKKIPDTMQLVLVGRTGYRHEQILRHAAAVPFGNTIHYYPWVPVETLNQLYANASAFLFPSLYEGFGFPLLEALSYGLPVVASDIPALREIGGKHALFVPPTVDGFFHGMQVALQKPHARYDTHLAQFSWENAAQKTLTVLRSALQ